MEETKVVPEVTKMKNPPSIIDAAFAVLPQIEGESDFRYKQRVMKNVEKAKANVAFRDGFKKLDQVAIHTSKKARLFRENLPKITAK